MRLDNIDDIVSETIQNVMESKELLNEGVSDIMYHFTSLGGLYGMLTGSFETLNGEVVHSYIKSQEPNGDNPDRAKQFLYGYKRYVCLTRSKFSGIGYAVMQFGDGTKSSDLTDKGESPALVRLTLDGRALNQRYKSTSFRNYPEKYSGNYLKPNKNKPHPEMMKLVSPSGETGGTFTNMILNRFGLYGTGVNEKAYNLIRKIGNEIGRAPNETEEQANRRYTQIANIVNSQLPPHSRKVKIDSVKKVLSQIIPSFNSETYALFKNEMNDPKFASLSYDEMAAYLSEKTGSQINPKDIEQIMVRDLPAIDRDMESLQEDRILTNELGIPFSYVTRIDILIHPKKGARNSAGLYELSPSLTQNLRRVLTYVRLHKIKIHIYDNEESFNYPERYNGIGLDKLEAADDRDKFNVKKKDNEEVVSDKLSKLIYKKTIDLMVLVETLLGDNSHKVSREAVDFLFNNGRLDSDNVVDDAIKLWSVPDDISAYVQLAYGKNAERTFRKIDKSNAKYTKYLTDLCYAMEDAYLKKYPMFFVEKKYAWWPADGNLGRFPSFCQYIAYILTLNDLEIIFSKYKKTISARIEALHKSLFPNKNLPSGCITELLEYVKKWCVNTVSDDTKRYRKNKKTVIRLVETALHSDGFKKLLYDMSARFITRPSIGRPKKQVEPSLFEGITLREFSDVSKLTLKEFTEKYKDDAPRLINEIAKAKKLLK